MQVAAEIRRGNVKHPKQVQIDDFKLVFKPPLTPEQKKRQQELEDQYAQMMWLARLGLDANGNRRSN